MKKSVIILFVLTTVAFCTLLYWLLFYADHTDNTPMMMLLSIGLLFVFLLLIWIYIRYFLAASKSNDKK